eukprot:UN12840
MAQTSGKNIPNKQCNEELKMETENRKNENGPFKFHNDTEQNLVDFVKSTAEQNDGNSVVKSIDTFCWNNHWMMHIGPEKGEILDKAIIDCKPKYILELGAYCGYSSIRMVTTNKHKNGIQNTKLYSIEINKYNVSIANQLIDYNGYRNNIQILNGNTQTIIPMLRQEISQNDKAFNGFGLVFIDHSKNVYLSDLQLIEKCGLVKSGTFIVADNVLVFGLNDYLSYVRNNGC